MIKNIINRIYLKLLKKKQFDSMKLRNFFVEKYGINVGMYTYGCFDAERIRRGTDIGRYCSFSPTSYVLTRNHPSAYITTHPFLYDASLGVEEARAVPFGNCIIEDDVWVGHNAVILPGAKVIGRGSIIGAGSVVTKDIPRYAIVAGSPARIIKYRFTNEVINKIEATRWWELSFELFRDNVRKNPKLFFSPSEIDYIK